MMIEVCDKCESRYDLVDDLVNKQVVCRKCLGAVGNLVVSLQGGNLTEFQQQTEMLSAIGQVGKQAKPPARYRPIDVMVVGGMVEFRTSAKWYYYPLCDPHVFDNVVGKINEFLPVETNDERQPLPDT